MWRKILLSIVSFVFFGAFPGEALGRASQLETDAPAAVSKQPAKKAHDWFPRFGPSLGKSLDDLGKAIRSIEMNPEKDKRHQAPEQKKESEPPPQFRLIRIYFADAEVTGKEIACQPLDLHESVRP